MTVTRGPASPVDDFLGPFGDMLAWRPEPLPDISDVLAEWDRFDPFWRADRSDEPVDELRTLALWDRWNHSVRLPTGSRPSVSRSGVPWMRVDDGFVGVDVHDASKPPTLWPFDLFPSVRVRLPKRPRPVLRFGDPNPTHLGDFTVCIVDPARGEVWDITAMGPSGVYVPGVLHLPLGRDWRCSRAVRWRVDRDWRDTPGSTVAAGFPKLPMTVSFEMLEGTAQAAAIQLVAPHYNSDLLPTGKRWVNDARKTDGATPGHPLWAGDRLRLRRDFELPDTATAHDRALVSILQRQGCVLADINDHAGPNAMAGFRGTWMPEVAGYELRVARDPRIDLSVELEAKDFEVLAAH